MIQLIISIVILTIIFYDRSVYAFNKMTSDIKDWIYNS